MHEQSCKGQVNLTCLSQKTLASRWCTKLGTTMSLAPSLYRSVISGVAYTELVTSVIHRSSRFCGHSPSYGFSSSLRRGIGARVREQARGELSPTMAFVRAVSRRGEGVSNGHSLHDLAQESTGWQLLWALCAAVSTPCRCHMPLAWACLVPSCRQTDLAEQHAYEAR